MFKFYIGSCLFYCMALCICTLRCAVLSKKNDIKFEKSTKLESLYNTLTLIVLMLIPLLNVLIGFILLFIGIFMDKHELINELKKSCETNGL